MRVKSGKQNIFILCCTFLIVVTSSCNNQSQLNKGNKIVQAKTNIQPFESRNDTIMLKYTTGVRSILEDSKGNIWFGSYNEGVCLLRNGEFQYFATENGLRPMNLQGMNPILSLSSLRKFRNSRERKSHTRTCPKPTMQLYYKASDYPKDLPEQLPAGTLEYPKAICWMKAGSYQD